MGVSPAGAGTVSDSQQTVFPGFSVQVSATPNEGYEFSHWETSDEQLSLPSQPTVTFTPTGSMFITAVFSQLYPCEENGVFAPLRGGLSIQGSGAGGWNWNGGTFGDTRSNGARFHSGLDFAATAGTPVYAMSAGCVVGGGYYEAGNKNRIYNNDGTQYVLHPDHQGSNNPAGNRISLFNEQDGYLVSYYHLAENNPIGWNPEENRPWEPGDCIPAGAIIGYVGQTGSATHPTSGGSHLHLGVRPASGAWNNISVGSWTDPQTHFSNMFINLGAQGQEVTLPCNDKLVQNFYSHSNNIKL